MAQERVVVKRALISVSDKSGVVEFGRNLVRRGVTVLSTGGTAEALKNGGVDVTAVEDYTGSPEIMDGRVKTLHPKIHGAILAVRDNEAHMRQAQDHGIIPVDMVVVNLYPFKQTVSRPGVSFEEAIENIDIGGPTMVRGAAKNHRYVAIVVDPADYGDIIAELDDKGGIALQTRLRLAVKAFSHTADYDAAIKNYLSDVQNSSF